MKQTLIIAILVVATLSFTSCATTNEKPAPAATAATAASPSENVEQALTRMEQGWVEQFIKGDAAGLVAAYEQVMADEWMGIGYDGKTYTKAQVIVNIKSGVVTAASITMDGMKVRVFGDTAMVTYYDTEKSTFQGKDTSGRYINTDVFVKRNGNWQLIAGQATRVEQPKQ